jgi:hypothetical protein
VNASRHEEPVLKIVYSSEVDQSIIFALTEVRKLVHPFLDEKIAKSALAGSDIVLRYIPIIMGDDHKHEYPARSRLERKKRIINCCPQLSTIPFVEGTLREQVSEYLSGLGEVAMYLGKLDVPSDNIEVFNEILALAKRTLG